MQIAQSQQDVELESVPQPADGVHFNLSGAYSRGPRTDLERQWADSMNHVRVGARADTCARDVIVLSAGGCLMRHGTRVPSTNQPTNKQTNKQTTIAHQKSRNTAAIVRAVQSEVEEAHRRKWDAVRQRRLARGGEKREFLVELREKRRHILSRLHRITREVCVCVCVCGVCVCLCMGGWLADWRG